MDEMSFLWADIEKCQNFLTTLCTHLLLFNEQSMEFEREYQSIETLVWELFDQSITIKIIFALDRNRVDLSRISQMLIHVSFELFCSFKQKTWRKNEPVILKIID